MNLIRIANNYIDIMVSGWDWNQTRAVYNFFWWNSLAPWFKCKIQPLVGTKVWTVHSEYSQLLWRLARYGRKGV